VRGADGSSMRDDPSVHEYDSLDDMHPFDRKQFEWMLDNGHIVITMGETVYQIRRDE
jgi:hypothetical protein